MICPRCRYVMDDLDSECTRCHGKGTPSPKVHAQQQVPHLEPPQPPSLTVSPQGYTPPARSLSAYMFGSAENSRNNSARLAQAVALLACLLALGGAIAYSISAVNGGSDAWSQNIQRPAMQHPD
jgi:hypothetical protein